MRVAARVAGEKAEHPERFCPAKKCLWRTDEGIRCPRHPESGKERSWFGWTFRSLSDGKVGSAVSVLAPEGETADTIRDYPSEEEVAGLAGVGAVRFWDRGDHPTRVESLYLITEVKP